MVRKRGMNFQPSIKVEAETEENFYGGKRRSRGKNFPSGKGGRGEHLIREFLSLN